MRRRALILATLIVTAALLVPTLSFLPNIVLPDPPGPTPLAIAPVMPTIPPTATQLMPSPIIEVATPSIIVVDEQKIGLTEPEPMKQLIVGYYHDVLNEGPQHSIKLPTSLVYTFPITGKQELSELTENMAYVVVFRSGSDWYMFPLLHVYKRNSDGTYTARNYMDPKIYKVPKPTEDRPTPTLRTVHV